MYKAATPPQQTLSGLKGEIYTDLPTRSMHSTDASVYQIIPTAVITPQSTDDVIAVVHHCRNHAISITARGGGTSQAGQAIGEGISLDFSKHMNRLLELNVEEQFVRVQPGMVLDELNAQLKPHGLQLPLDLSTSSRATIGGMIANNSAGTRSVIYGKTLDYVEELTVVLSDGTLVTMGPMDGEGLRTKSSQTDLEGSLYRTVRQLGEDHAAEIDSRYPKILRRVGGYNLDEFVPKRIAHSPTYSPTHSPTLNRSEESVPAFSLARMMVGSEGTLGLTVEAKLRVVPLPKHRILCSIQFTDLLEAMKATPVILAHGPSAVELVDRFLLDKTKGKIKFEPLRDFIQGDPGAVLLVEFFGESAEELPDRVDKLEADLFNQGLGHHLHRAVTPAAQARIWELRKGALGLTMAEAGDAKAISFVEDTAVPPEMLHDYIDNFQRILAKYETEAAFYAHASVGLLHIRPVVNMKTGVGVERFQAIADEVADLVLEYGGSLSGEHGDGLVRAPFQERIFGAELYGAFCEIKETFDPDGIFNPGKIVHAPELTSDLRFGADYKTPTFDTAYDFSDFGGFVQAAEQCSGVGACRKTLTGTMCPSYMATRNETDSTRGRANALRQVFNGQLDRSTMGANGFDNEELLPVLDLCLECKACKSECPTGVDMARLKSEFLHQHHQRKGATLKERLLSRADLIGRWGSRTAPISNWLFNLPITRWFNEKLLGLDSRRPLPTFARQSFTARWQKDHSSRSIRRSDHELSTSDHQSEVVLFPDTFNNYYEPATLTAAARLIEAQGGVVEVPPSVCCGRPLISKGFLDQAADQASMTTQALLPLVERGLPILFCEPSCYSAVVDDHPKLLRGQQQKDAQKVADACLLVEEWHGPREAQFRAGPKKIILHGHCHQKALVGVNPLVKQLSAIPNCEVVNLDSGCCGMAGSFGYEHYEISQAIGERRLLPAVREMDEEAVAVGPGFSCRHQIKHFTGTKALSPSELLHSLLR